MELFRMRSQGATVAQKRIRYVKRAAFALAIAALFAGCSGCSQCGTGTPEGRAVGALSDVSDFSVVFVNGEATLYWVDPTDASFDHVEISWDPDGTSPVGVVRGLGKYVIPDLELGKTYKFTVRAVDKDGGVSDTSTGGTGTAFKQRRSPNAPPWELTGIKGTPVANQATLSWTNLDDSEYEYIEITFAPGYESVYRVAKGVESKTLTNLTNGVEHTFYVAAVDSQGNRKPINDVGLFISGHATSSESISGYPKDGRVSLVWVDPDDPHLDHLEVVYSPDGYVPLNVPVGVQKQDISGLSDDTEYEFIVYAADIYGHRRPLTGVGFGIPDEPPPQEPTTTARSDESEIRRIRGRPVAGQIRLDWTDPPGPGIDHIEILYTPGGTAVPTSVAMGVETHTFTGLSDTTEYGFQIYGVDAAGNKHAISGLRLVTPEPPARVAIRPVSGEVTIYWDDPDDPDLNHIEVSYSPGGRTPVQVAKGVQKHTFTGLSDNVEYVFSVNAIIAGNTRAIAAKGAAVPELPVLVGTPTNGQLGLAWTDPPNVRVDHIEIMYAPGGERPVTIPRGTENRTFSGLTNGLEHRFTVYAVDNVGNRHPVTAARIFVPPTVSGVTVNPATVGVNPGATQQFSASVAGANNPPQTVTWTVAGGAGGTTISATGLLSVGVNQAIGTITVTATSTLDTSRSGSATVTITPLPPTVTSVTVNPATLGANPGATQQFTASVVGTNDPPQTVTWTVTGGSAGTSISATGLLTIGPNQALGSLTVRATSTLNTARSGTATVTVTALPPTVTGVTVNPATAGVNPGATQQFSASVVGTNNPPQTVAWSVSGGVAGTSISATGLLTVSPNQAVGTLAITATSTLDASRTGTATVTVTPLPPTVTSVTVDPATVGANPGAVQQFTATVEGTNDPPQTVTWTVTGGSGGTAISATGLLTIGANQALGSVTVRATSTLNTSRSGTAVVTVTALPPTVTGVAVSPAATTVEQGSTQQFTSSVAGTNNPPQTVTWAVTGGTAGTSITANGLLTVSTSQAAGTLTVTATSTLDTSRSGTAAVTVPPPPPPPPPPPEPPSTQQSLSPLNWRASNSAAFGDSSVLTLSYGATGAGAIRWLAGGVDGKIGYSEDHGVNWRLVSDSTFGASTVNAIAYNNGRWIAVGRDGRVAWSTNATTWTAVGNTHFTREQTINAVAYANGRWLAGGSNGMVIWSSDNGATWSRVVISSFGQSTINSLAFRGNRWVAGGTQGKMAYSNDNGATWTAVANTTFGESDVNVIINDRGRWYAGGYGQRVAWSSDGVAWRALTRPFYILGMGYNGSRWIAGGQDGRMAWSVDSGDTWNTDNNGRNLFGDSWVQAVTYGMATSTWRWVAAGQNGKIIYADEPQ